MITKVKPQMRGRDESFQFMERTQGRLYQVRQNGVKGPRPCLGLEKELLLRVLINTSRV